MKLKQRQLISETQRMHSHLMDFNSILATRYKHGTLTRQVIKQALELQKLLQALQSDLKKELSNERSK